MRVALCQINPIVGDLDGNCERILGALRAAAAEGADLAVLPELALTGYPPRDLLDRPAFIDACATVLPRLIAQMPAELYAIVGTVRHAGGKLFNAAACLRGPTLEAWVHKRLLPTYDVFDEDRYFAAGDAPGLVTVAGRRVGVTICEDAWNSGSLAPPRPYGVNPVHDCVSAGAELLVNLSASPFTLDKRGARRKLLRGIVAQHGRPVVFVNQVGGNDDLIFDGHSMVLGADGEVLARAAEFREDMLVCELDAEGAGSGALRSHEEGQEAVVLQALVLGTADYARKCGFDRAMLGLSGGIDSAVTACVAAKALGPDRVLGVAMPSRYSSAHSLDDAHALAAALGMELHELPIEPMHQAFAATLEGFLDQRFGAPGAADVTFENLQARIRGALLMAVSNRSGALLLTTGNKSELAVGYCTLYGDMNGGLAVISDLPKTWVYGVAREINRQAGRALIPESTLNKAPSAELRPNQTDQDSLPDYALLDPILERYVERGLSIAAIVAEGYPAAVVERIARMVRMSEYKRRQMPPGLIVTRKAFGPGRRYPIAQGFSG